MGNHGQTEGGGALSLLAMTGKQPATLSEDGQQHRRWYALWTHSHCEQLVSGQLDTRGFEVFFPTIGVWSWRAGVKHRIRRPLFPGYLFVRDELSGARYVELLKARGLVGVLGGQDGGPGGILVDRRAGKGLLVLSVHLFRRSVAVEVDCASAVAA